MKGLQMLFGGAKGYAGKTGAASAAHAAAATGRLARTTGQPISAASSRLHRLIKEVPGPRARETIHPMHRPAPPVRSRLEIARDLAKRKEPIPRPSTVQYGPHVPNDELRRQRLHAMPASPGAMALPSSPKANAPIKPAGNGIGGTFPLHQVGGGMLLGGIAGYTTGDQDAWSFAKGAAVGGLGGLALTAGRGSIVSGAENIAERYAAKSSDPNVAAAWRARGAKAREFGEMLDTKEGRVATFAAGSMLAGGGFNAIFNGGNRRNHKRGFNQNRGNTF